MKIGHLAPTWSSLETPGRFIPPSSHAYGPYKGYPFRPEAVFRGSLSGAEHPHLSRLLSLSWIRVQWGKEPTGIPRNKHYLLQLSSGAPPWKAKKLQSGEKKRSFDASPHLRRAVLQPRQPCPETGAGGRDREARPLLNAYVSSL